MAARYKFASRPGPWRRSRSCSCDHRNAGAVRHSGDARCRHRMPHCRRSSHPIGRPRDMVSLRMPSASHLHTCGPRARALGCCTCAHARRPCQIPRKFGSTNPTLPTSHRQGMGAGPNTIGGMDRYTAFHRRAGGVTSTSASVSLHHTFARTHPTPSTRRQPARPSLSPLDALWHRLETRT